MQLIVAVDRYWAIGKDGGLLAHIQEDMQFFREATMGHVIVMGRKTLDSFPGGMALDGRTNMVLTKNTSFSRKNVEVLHSKEEALLRLKDYADDDVFIIGGESIYRMFLDECDTAFVTKIEYAYDADTHFPNLDEDDAWECTYISEEKTSFDLTYTFRTYKRKK